MHVRNRLLAGCVAGALLAALLPAGVAAAELVPGRPGRYELSSIEIDATSGDCKATYETPAEGNLWMRGVEASVRVHINPNWVHVTCRFTDISALIEANAEVGYTDACTVVTDTETYTDGWGIATSAANIGERADGGNSMAMCRFRISPRPTAAGPALGAKPAHGPPGLATDRQRGRPPTAQGSKPERPRGDRPADRSGSRGSAKKAEASAAAKRPAAKPEKAAKTQRASKGAHRRKAGGR